MIEGGQTGKTAKPQCVTLGKHRHGIFTKRPAHNGRQPVEPARIAGFGGHRKILSPVICQAERDTGMRHGKAFERVAHSHHFGALGFQKFQARRRCIKQVSDFNARAACAGRWTHIARHAAGHRQSAGLGCIGRARCDGHFRHRPDRRQGFSAKAQRGDAEKIVAGIPIGQFRRGMTLQRQSQVRRAHAATVILDPYQAFAAIFQRDIYAFGTGINGVFNQLFHRAGRTLDNFTGGNAVDRAFV